MNDHALDGSRLDEDISALASPSLPLIALVVGAIPFVASFRTTHTRTSASSDAMGVSITETTVMGAIDYVAVVFGALAIIVGLMAAARGFRFSNKTVGSLGMAAVALGVYQVLRGTLLLL